MKPTVILLICILLFGNVWLGIEKQLLLRRNRKLRTALHWIATKKYEKYGDALAERLRQGGVGVGESRTPSQE
jgi:hypothetical protein